jgi:hypothetical protein
MSVNPVNARELYLVYSALHFTHFYHSTDGGVSWDSLAPPAEITHNGFVDKIFFHPYCPDTLFFYRDSYHDLFRSLDHGDSWEYLGTIASEIHHYEFIPGDPATIWCGIECFGVIGTHNLGETWEVHNDGFVDNYGTIHCVKAAAGNPSLLYALGWPLGCDPNYLYRSTNAGERWNLIWYVSEYDGIFIDICTDPFDTNGIFLTMIDSPEPVAHVYHSLDRGDSWSVAGEVPFGFGDLIAHPHQRGTLYCCADNNFFRSRDYGVTWDSLNTGLVDIDYGTSFSYTRTPSDSMTFFAVMHNSLNDSWSLYTLTDTTTSLMAVEQHPPATPTAVSLAAAPNPFNPAVNLSWKLEQPGVIQLEIFNLEGQRVENHRAFHNAGRNRFTWNAGNMAAGVYVARLTCFHGEKPYSRAVRKLVLVK